MKIDYVLGPDGDRIGVSAGRTIDHLDNRMLSLAFVDSGYAAEGTAVSVLWGTAGRPQTTVCATVIPMPAYQGEFRNERFDTSAIPSLVT